MSGHSKWHNIQGRKGKQDAVRSNQFTKSAKMITIAAQKGADPEMNFSLRLAIDKAKAVGMPKDNIDRAIKRGTGELSDGVQMEELLYEGFGPGGTALIIKIVTDNKNRASSETKHILSKHGGNLGTTGSVQWMFELRGLIIVPLKQLEANKINEDEFELSIIDAGADDIVADGELLEIKTKPEQFQKVLTVLKNLAIEPLESGIRFLPKETMTVNEEVKARLEALFSELEEHDDVEDYYTNAI